jgi:DHA2 family multidrug resistance protein-like MFS transporter
MHRSAAPEATHSGQDGLPAPRRAFALLAILAAIVLAVLDGTIANVALPTITEALAVSPSDSIWIVTSYQAALVIALLPVASVGERVGYRRVFTLGVALFTLASIACALAPGLPWLIGARFVQGLGGAAIMSPIAALLRFSFPHRLLGTAIGWNAMTVALASAAGPMIGAGILAAASWPWLFAVNVPVGALVLVAARALPLTPHSPRSIDAISIALNAVGFAALVVGVDALAARPASGVALLGVAMLSLGALIHRELRQPTPLIPLDLWRVRSFRISVIASVCCFTAQMASFVALPFYLQHALGQSIFATGLYMTPWPLTVALAAPLAGHLSNRVSTAWLCAAGGSCLALGLVLAAFWPLRGNLAPLVAFTMVAGAGFGFFQTPNNRNMLLSAPRERSGAAGAMQSLARLVGQTTGAVLMALLFALAPAGTAPRIGLAAAAALALAAGLVSTVRAPR